MTSTRPNGSDEALSASANREIWELIRTLVLGKASAEEMLELYYWSRDPEILQMLRSVIILPESSRHQLVEFLAESDPKHISIIEQSSPRRLILTE